ncbi:MAG TPA: flagellar motor protein [Gammaproteobacteria bacterium]|nr:flagellar motor protein [Gammaproteobacteria bacterium]
MDKLALLGALLVVFVIYLGQTMEGEQFSSLLNAPALLIVVGGTLGAVMIQVPYKVFSRAISMFSWVLVPPQINWRMSIKKLVMWSEITRRDGILGLESHLRREQDPFTKKAMQLLVDGREPEVIRETLETEIETREAFEHSAAKVYESMGGYAPTIGILGAVMGLIHVMGNLSDPNNLGAGIATAFVATIYGVGLANLFLIPVSKKISAHIEENMREKHMIMEGMISIASGENPRNIAVRLKAYY